MIKIPVSVGELADKITILRIKKEKISDETKLKNISKELKSLEKKFYSLDINHEVLNVMEELSQINKKLWEVEDNLRVMESANDFSEDFIGSARSVYKLNDQRFIYKKAINIITQSKIVEEKSYKEY
jgi:hypothetical protein